MNDYFEQVVTELRDKLPEFLALHGRNITTRGLFKCVTGTHEDKTPSCGILPGNRQVWRCFQCGKSGNIFHVASYLEGLPTNGPGFVIKTIPTLAKRFGLVLDEEKLRGSKEAIHTLALWSVLQDAANILVSKGNFQHAASRGWTEDTCRSLGIGTIAFEGMKKELLELGHEDNVIKDAGIIPALFHEQGLTFSIKDQWGRPIGFATRDMLWTKDSKTPKYVNTSSSVPMFGKRENLYNFDVLRGRAKEVIIVEGYGCVATAWQCGQRNVVACCSAQISQEQVEMLVKARVNTCILALDTDEAGRNGTIKALDECFGYRDDIRAKVLDMTPIANSDAQPSVGPPRRPGHCDLDELFRIDPQALRKLQPTDSFEWRLSIIPEDTESEEICKMMIPLIINEPSNVRREKLSAILSNATGVRKVAIDRDVDSAVKRADMEVKAQAENIKSKISRKLLKASPGMIPEILEEGVAELRELFGTPSGDKFSKTTTLSFLDETRKRFQEAKEGLTGLDCGFDCINRATNGIPLAARLIGVPAQPNVGKTGLVTAIGYNTLVKNPNSNHLVRHFTIDDSRDAVISRIIAMDANVDISLVTQPIGASKAQREAMDKAWARLSGFIESGRFDIRDAGQGTSLNYLEEWLKFTHEEFPDRPILVIFDNFHKLEGDGNELRIKFLNASQRLQRFKHNPKLGRPSIIATMEMVKTKDRQAGVFDIAETNQILYDADMIIILHSEFIGSGENAKHFWTNPEDNSIQPMVKMCIEKNKITSVKGVSWLRFLARRSRFTEDKNYKPMEDSTYD